MSEPRTEVPVEVLWTLELHATEATTGRECSNVRVHALIMAAREQAATEARRELLAKVEGLPNRHPETVGGRTGYGHRGFEEARAAVLALVAPSEKGARG